MENKNQNSVKLGDQVEIQLIYRSGHKEKLTLDLVVDSKADIDQGYLGESTPLATAILDEPPGTIVPFFTSELFAVEILSVHEASREPDPEVSKRRKQSLKDTLNRIEFRDAILFASSTETKWGQYDPDGLEQTEWHSRGSSKMRKRDDEGEKT
jgi:hypothetical protein